MGYRLSIGSQRFGSSVLCSCLPCRTVFLLREEIVHLSNCLDVLVAQSGDWVGRVYTPPWRCRHTNVKTALVAEGAAGEDEGVEVDVDDGLGLATPRQGPH